MDQLDQLDQLVLPELTCRIISAGRDTLLKVPVSGGNRSLRSRNWREAVVSGHGDWQRKHLAAISTAYGRTPFFDHYFPEIERLILSCTPGETLLGDFLDLIDSRILEWISLPEGLLACGEESAVRKVCRELSEEVLDDVSVIDVLMRLGPDATFALAGRYLLGSPAN